MSRVKFTDWLDELRIIVEQNFEKTLDDFPEYDVQDARAYFKEGSSPMLYVEECLAESIDGEKLSTIMNGGAA